MMSKSATGDPKPEHRFSVTLNYELERSQGSTHLLSYPIMKYKDRLCDQKTVFVFHDGIRKKMGRPL